MFKPQSACLPHLENLMQESIDAKNLKIAMFAIISTVIAFLLIFYSDFGIYIVIGYILYRLESISIYQITNAHESSYFFAKLYKQLNEDAYFELSSTSQEVTDLIYDDSIVVDLNRKSKFIRLLRHYEDLEEEVPDLFSSNVKDEILKLKEQLKNLKIY